MLIRTLALLHLLTVLAFTLGGCGGVEERKANYMERGLKYLEAQNYDKARIEFRNVLQIDPKFARAYFHLGRIEEARRNWRDSFAYYRKAAEIDPTDIGTRIKLAYFSLLQKRTDETAALVEGVLAAEPNNIEARMLQAALAELRGDGAAAVALAARIVEAHPERTDAYSVLSLLHARRGDLPAAERALEQGLERHPGDMELLLSLARLRQRMDRPERTEAALRAVLAREPLNPVYRQWLADFYRQRNRLDAAEQVYREGAALEPDNAARHLALARFLAGRGKTAEAIEALVDASAAHPENADFRFALAEFYGQGREFGRVEQVYRDVAVLRRHTPDALEAKNRLALMAHAGGREGDALALTEEILEDNPRDYRALLLRGRIALSRGEAQAAIAAFRAVLKEQPDVVEVLGLLAEAQILDGRPVLAEEALTRAVTAHPESFAARRNLVRFRVSRNQIREAMGGLDEFLERYPLLSLEGWNLKADLLIWNGRAEEHEAVLKRIEADFPGDPAGPFRLGRFYRAERRYEAALAAYEEALARSRRDFEILDALAEIHEATGHPERALARIRQALEEDPRNPGFHHLLGIRHLRQQREQAAVEAFVKTLELDPQWLPAYLALGSHYERQGMHAAAMETYRRGLAVLPNEPLLHLSLAHLHEQAADYPGAIERYEAALAADPGNAIAANNLATLLSLPGSNREQLLRALELARRFENSAEPAWVDTLAWVHYRLGDYERALSLQTRVVELAPDTPIFRYHLGMILLRKESREKAREELQKAVASGADFLGAEEARQILGRP